MHVHENATVDVSNEDASTLGLLHPDRKLTFPLTHAKVVVNGDTAVISVNSEGERAQRIDRLTSASYDEEKNGTIKITGLSSLLLDEGVAEDDASVTFIIVKSAELVQPGVAV